MHLPWLTLLSFRLSLLQIWCLFAAELLVKSLCLAGLKHASGRREHMQLKQDTQDCMI